MGPNDLLRNARRSLRLHKRLYGKHICPKCKKDYGDIFGLWFSAIIKSINEVERTCKMCGYQWST